MSREAGRTVGGRVFLAAVLLLLVGACAERRIKDGESAAAARTLALKAKTEREARIFASTCAHCHIGHSGGIPRAGFPSDWNQRKTKDFDQLVQHAIDGYRDMPPLGTCSYCSRAEIAAMTALLVAGSDIRVPGAASITSQEESR